MFCKLGNSSAGKGLFIIGFFLFAVMGSIIFFKSQQLRKNVNYDQSSSRIENLQVREVIVNDNAPVRVVNSTESSSNITININTQSSSLFGYLIQLLFWAFLISPPVIVVLLLVIIGKMSSKNSIK